MIPFQSIHGPSQMDGRWCRVSLCYLPAGNWVDDQVIFDQIIGGQDVLKLYRVALGLIEEVALQSEL